MKHMIKKRPKVRSFKMLLTLALTLGMLSGMIPGDELLIAAKAEPGVDGKTITGLGTGAIGDPVAPDPQDTETPWKGNYVYFGKYKADRDTEARPVRYRVLDNATDRFGGNTMLLDCDSTLFTDAFRDDKQNEDANVWNKSDIYKRLNTNGDSLLNTGFSSPEREAIAESRIGAHQYTTDSTEEGAVNVTQYTSETYGNGYYTPLTGEKIFLLDVEDVSNTSYGYSMQDRSSENRRKKASDGIASYWWLRSPYSLDTQWAGIVDHPDDSDDVDGFLNWCHVDYYYGGVSPAFNLNLSSVIFTSLIQSSPGEEKTEKEYKLTVSDNKLSISATECTREGNVVTVSYKITDDSVSSNPTQVSVVVTDGRWIEGKGWNSTVPPRQYTKLNMEGCSLKGTGTFTLDSEKVVGAWGKDYHVYILAEDINGNKETDYASAPTEIRSITATVNGYKGKYDGQPHGISVEVDNPESGAEVKFGTSEGTYNLDKSPVIKNVEDSPLTVYYQIKVDGYLTKTGLETVTIEKGPSKVAKTPDGRTGLIYNGKAQALIIPGEAEGGELKYALSKDSSEPEESEYSAVIPSARDSGNYTVWFKVSGDKNHFDTKAQSLKVSIAEKSGGKEEEKPTKVPFTETGEAYASAEDNFAAVAPGSSNGIGGSIKKLTLDFSNVNKSCVDPSDLKITAVNGSKFTTIAKLKDRDSAKADGGVKVKIGKDLIPLITCKKDGGVTLTMEDGNTYTIKFTVQKPKAQKAEKKLMRGNGTATKSIRQLFGTDIDAGKLMIVRQKHSQAFISDNTLVINPEEKDSIKLQYRYLDKKYKITIMVK